MNGPQTNYSASRPAPKSEFDLACDALDVRWNEYRKFVAAHQDLKVEAYGSTIPDWFLVHNEVSSAERKVIDLFARMDESNRQQNRAKLAKVFWSADVEWASILYKESQFILAHAQNAEAAGPAAFPLLKRVGEIRSMAFKEQRDALDSWLARQDANLFEIFTKEGYAFDDKVLVTRSIEDIPAGTMKGCVTVMLIPIALGLTFSSLAQPNFI
jgi:hypothetical protein